MPGFPESWLVVCCHFGLSLWSAGPVAPPVGLHSGLGLWDDGPMSPILEAMFLLCSFTTGERYCQEGRHGLLH